VVGVSEIAWLALVPKHQAALDSVAATQPLVDCSLVSTCRRSAAGAAIAVGEEVKVGVGGRHAPLVVRGTRGDCLGDDLQHHGSHQLEVRDGHALVRGVESHHPLGEIDAVQSPLAEDIGI